MSSYHNNKTKPIARQPESHRIPMAATPLHVYTSTLAAPYNKKLSNNVIQTVPLEYIVSLFSEINLMNFI
jgi:hypothetical protein